MAVMERHVATDESARQERYPIWLWLPPLRGVLAWVAAGAEPSLARRGWWVGEGKWGEGEERKGIRIGRARTANGLGMCVCLS